MRYHLYIPMPEELLHVDKKDIVKVTKKIDKNLPRLHNIFNQDYLGKRYPHGWDNNPKPLWE